LGHCTFDFESHQLQCRMCSATCPNNSNDASKWMVCQLDRACCLEYAVCRLCSESQSHAVNLCSPVICDTVPSQVN
jgi:hypothetical protein